VLTPPITTTQRLPRTPEIVRVEAQKKREIYVRLPNPARENLQL